MTFSNKHKALTVTALLVGIFTLVLLNMHFSFQIKQQNETNFNLNFEEVLEEDQESNVETHRAFNEAESPEESATTTTGNEDAEKSTAPDKSTDEKILEELEAEDDYLEKLEDRASNGTENLPEAEKPPSKKPANDKAKTPEGDPKETANKSTSNYYHLKGRKPVHFPNPVYTCDGAGKVVVNITVMASGVVTKAEYNKASSTTTDGCMIENALEYAKKTVFNTTTDREQIGTITYVFPGQ